MALEEAESEGALAGLRINICIQENSIRSPVVVLLFNFIFSHIHVDQFIP